MKKNKGLIITPTLGKSPYLTQTVASVQEYGMGARHVIVCPANVVNAVQNEFPDIEVISEPEDCKSMYNAINHGIETSTTEWEWFSYINDDDLLKSGFKMAVEILEANKSGEVFYGDVELIDASGKVIRTLAMNKNGSGMLEQWAERIAPISQHGAIIKKSVLIKNGNFVSTYKYAADMDMWVRLAANNINFVYVPATVGAFRVADGQLSTHRTSFDNEINHIREKYRLNEIPKIKRFMRRIQFMASNTDKYINRLFRGDLKPVNKFFTK